MLRRWLIFLALLVLATWARVRIVDGLADQGYFAKYVVFADQILAGEPPRHRIGDVSPAYLWLTVWFRAMGMSLRAIRTTQIVMTSLAALACAFAARRLGGWIAAATATILLLGNHAVLVNASELEPETLILLLAACAVAATVARRYALAGVLVGLAIIARPAALIALVFVAAWIAWKDRRAAIRFAACALIAPLAIVIVNYRLAGQAMVMSPGTVFYEAHNPLSTGAAGVMPRVIADLNARGPEPDYLHVAYRLVAAKATGGAVDARVANRYWSGKAFAFLREHPLAGARIVMWKAILTVHHYDVYDLVTMKRKALELARWPGIPFGVAFVLAVMALVLRRDRRERRELLPVALFAAATLTALLLVNVSARQRNPLLAPLAILGGVAVAELVSLARARSERALIAFGAAIVAMPLLGIEGRPMREDAYNWWATLRSSSLEAAARKTRDPREAMELAASASILDTAGRPLVTPDALRAVALATAQTTSAPERLFDIALALQKAGAWRESDAILAAIDDYRPLRENRAVSSIAYYRARAAIHLRQPEPTIRALLDRAYREAPGDPHVLALRAVALRDPRAASELDALHDVLTRDAARAAARAASRIED